jgi:hypothetical protein
MLPQMSGKYCHIYCMFFSGNFDANSELDIIKIYSIISPGLKFLLGSKNMSTEEILHEIAREVTKVP